MWLLPQETCKHNNQLVYRPESSNLCNKVHQQESNEFPLCVDILQVTFRPEEKVRSERIVFIEMDTACTAAVHPVAQVSTVQLV